MDNKEIFIPVILGTGREGRLSDIPANWMVKKVQETGAQSELIDVKDWIESPFTSNARSSDKAKALAEKFERADGVVVVAPEYNHGYPGELKLMLDMFFPEWGRIPCGICGVSYGKLG
ncbi:NADPH-dependent FMN reductase, partial [Patescibacteria group bacterium]